MSESCKSLILQLLTKFPNGLPGGTIEKMIAEISMYKPSNVSRRCRELFNEDKLLKRFDKLNGVKFVSYKLK